MSYWAEMGWIEGGAGTGVPGGVIRVGGLGEVHLFGGVWLVWKGRYELCGCVVKLFESVKYNAMCCTFICARNDVMS